MSSTASRRLLAVHAHPDDESSKGAATYARYVAEGADVLVVSCTGGERGDVLNPTLADVAPTEAAMAARDIAGLRRLEMERAQSVIGFEHRWLGYLDSGMPGEGEQLPAGCFALIPIEHSAEPLVRMIREFRPQVIVTYDENGGYPHPDHIRTHEVSVYAMEAAADADRYPDAGEAWQVSKLYYDRIFNGPRARAVFTALEQADPDAALTEEVRGYVEWVESRPDTATTHIECGEYFDKRDEALRAHASQVPPDSRFFFWPNDLQREAWPTEDFELARSTVTLVLPESDFFAGIEHDIDFGLTQHTPSKRDADLGTGSTS